MATTKITDLTAYTDPVNTDVLPIVDVTSDVTKKVSIANVMKNASLGTAAAPGIAFDGDSNTGIYSPAANQVAITTDGTQRMLIDSAGAVTIAGDLTVNGTTTNINTQNLVVEDKNIVLGDVTSPTDVTADGGGITLKGTTDKTINWVDSTDAWTSSENVDVASGKSYRINGTEVLSATALGSAVQISSSNIPSGTIVNDDVNASAAIAGTKISPDFGSQTVQTTGIFSHALGTAGAPTVTFTGDTNTGIYSPGADQVAISTAGSGRVFIGSTGTVNFTGAGTAGSTQAVSFNGSAPVNSLVIDSSGRLGVGTSSPGVILDVRETATGATTAILLFNTDNTNSTSQTARIGLSPDSRGAALTGLEAYKENSDFSTSAARDVSLALNVLLNNAKSEAVRITSAGNVGIGASPSAKLHVNTGTNENLWVGSLGGSGAGVYLASVNDSGSANTPMQIGSASVINFAINGNEAARIDSSRRLLVGTSSTSADHRAIFQSTPADGTGFGQILVSRGSSAGLSDGSALGVIAFADSGHVKAAQIAAFVDGGYTSGSDMPSRLVFSTTADGASSPTERMRIGQSGLSYFFSSGSTALYTVSSSAAGTTNNILQGGHSATSTTTGTTSFVVSTNGNVQNTNGSYTAISDAKLKENIVDAGSQWNDLKAIQIRNWNFKAETGHETHRQIGPIAQELETVCPGLVFETPDRDEDGNETGEVTKGVNQSVLYMKAVKALQEAMERIEQLETEMAAVKAQLS